MLALLGNSGAPHLHVHVTDANSGIGSERVPYVFDHFEVQGMATSDDPNADWKAILSPLTTGQNKIRTRETPVEDAGH